MNEELDSQLSAMFDDELPSEECELLARRLSRDEQLKARWGRYAVIGAAIRSEHGVRLNVPLAGRVSAVISAEPALPAAVAPAGRRARLSWWQPLAGAAVAAGVAAVSVLWLRAQLPGGSAPLTAQVAAPTPSQLAPPESAARAAPSAADSYVVPRAPTAPAALVPSTELANYVVAHSMYSSPVARRNLLSAFMTSEPGAAAAGEPADEAAGNAQ